MTGATLHIPTLETERLRLRAPVMADFETYAAFRMSDRAAPLGALSSRAEAFDILCAVTGHWQLRGFGRWIVADRASDAPLGLVGLFQPMSWPEPEIGWQVFNGAEGKGYAAEAAIASRHYAYEVLGWHRIVSLILPSNARSLALARRLGAEHEADFEHETFGSMQVWRHLPLGAQA